MRFLKKFRGELILLLAAILWGTCFVFQKKSMDFVGTYTLGTLRFLIGAAVLSPFVFVSGKVSQRWKKSVEEKKQSTKFAIIGGIICGSVLFPAASFQQEGMKYISAGKAGFLSSLEIIAVAVIMIFIEKRLKISTIISVCVAVVGMYFLCMNGEKLSLGKGEMLELCGVIFWGLQIVLAGYFSRKCDGIMLSVVQFTTIGLISAVAMCIFEAPSWTAIKSGIYPILYTAVVEVAIAYTLQIIGQRYASPVVSSVIMSLESVFAALSGAILLGEKLSGKEFLGCVLMFSAVIAAQLPSPERKKIEQRQL